MVCVYVTPTVDRDPCLRSRVCVCVCVLHDRASLHRQVRAHVCATTTTLTTTFLCVPFTTLSVPTNLCVSMLLTARALAEHNAEATAPSTPVSARSSAPSSASSSCSSNPLSSASTPRETEGVRIGQTTSAHTEKTEAAYNSGKKWTNRALEKLGATWDDLILNPDTTCDPNDELASRVHNLVCEWQRNHTTARELGIKTHTQSKQDCGPPVEIYRLVKANLRDYINAKRDDKHIGLLDSKWARNLAGARNDTVSIHLQSNDERCRDGSRYHNRQDLTLTHQQMMTMSVVGLTGSARVDADLLHSVETGAAFAIWNPTGARTSELTRADMQSLGVETIEYESNGTRWPCMHFMSLNTKTGSDHRNMFLPTSNPWMCGVAGLGMSILVRIRNYGHGPPLSMCNNSDSWKILITTGEKKTMDRRLNTLFELAQCRRQKRDVLSYAGRHIGTRNLQHQGGTAEGGAARRNHKQGNAAHHYITVPLGDLQRLSGNYADDRAFVPAHLTGGTLHDLTDATLRLIYASLFDDRDKIERMNAEVDAARGDRVKKRTELQLCDLERLNDGVLFACRTTLLCLVARPRKWERWTIDESQLSLWEQWLRDGNSVRTIQFLFSDRPDAIAAMSALADAVRVCELSEIRARQASPSDASTHAMATTMRDIQNDNRVEQERLVTESRAQQQQILEYMATLMGGSGNTSPPPPPPPPVSFSSAPPPAATVPVAAPSCLCDPLPRCGVKRARDEVSRDVIVPVAKWSRVSEMVDYARDHVARMDREQGSTWRVLHKPDGRVDNSVQRHYLAYRRVCAAVGVTSVEDVQTEMDTCGKSITKWLDGLAAANNARANPLVLETAANRVMGV